MPVALIGANVAVRDARRGALPAKGSAPKQSDADWDDDWKRWVCAVSGSPHPEERMAARIDAGVELILRYFPDVTDVVRALTKRPLREHTAERRELLIEKICARTGALAADPAVSLRTAVRRITFATAMRWEEP
jgi:hypothetical protein